MKRMVPAALSLFLGTAALAQTNWTEKISLKGDVRLRGQSTDDEVVATGKKHERNQLRMRARLQVNAKVNDNTEAVLRYATGAADEISTTTSNVDMTDYGSKKVSLLDLAYANYKPNETAQIWVGKSPVVYFQPGNSDMIFDSDVTSEGLSYKDSWKNESMSVFWNLGWWLVDELHTSTTGVGRAEVTLVGGDVGLNMKMGEINFLVGAGKLNFANIQNSPVATSGARGNTLSGAGYANKYDLTRGFLEISAPVAGMPMALYFDYVQNEDPSEDNVGTLVGVKFGKLKDVGNWTFSLDRRDVEADATLGIFAESDTGGGGTNIINTRATLGYQLANATSAGLHYSVAERRANAGGVKTDFERIMLDLVYAF